MEDVNSYFNLVYDATFSELAKACVLKAKRVQDVDDLLQSTYERFYKHIRRHGPGVVNDPKSYLYTILSKELAKYYRFHARWLTEPLEETTVPLAGDEQPESDSLDRLTLDEIWAIVEREPQLSQKVFILYYEYDMRVAEIAQATGLTESAVKNRLLHTRNRIRTVMQKEGTA